MLLVAVRVVMPNTVIHTVRPTPPCLQVPAPTNPPYATYKDEAAKMTSLLIGQRTQPPSAGTAPRCPSPSLRPSSPGMPAPSTPSPPTPSAPQPHRLPTTPLAHTFPSTHTGTDELSGAAPWQITITPPANDTPSDRCRRTLARVAILGEWRRSTVGLRARLTDAADSGQPGPQHRMPFGTQP
jgi:hypothetical protein